jgi:hypothetical protein
MTIPTQLHGSETWVLGNERNECRIQSTEIETETEVSWDVLDQAGQRMNKSEKNCMYLQWETN